MSEIEKIMAEAAEKVRREGYAAGWRDAMAAVAKAAAEARPSEMPQETGADMGTYIPPVTVPITANGPLPAVGTIPHFVLAEVRRRPGSTGAEIVGALNAQGHPFAEPQIRTNLKRLEIRELIINRHRKWYPR